MSIYIQLWPVWKLQLHLQLMYMKSHQQKVQIFCKHHYIESNFVIVLGSNFTSSNIMETSTSKNEISISIIVVM